MGGTQSGLEGSPEFIGPGLGDLPESCVAAILGRLSPPEICKFAELNKAFCRASLADIVWESKLPSNYEFLVSKVLGECCKGVSKKEIYRRLCEPIKFDSGTKMIWMERSSGKMSMAISWKGMNITGINDRRYWSHIPSQESRFDTIAYLRQVWWLEVGGELEFNFPAGTYSIIFRLQIGKPLKRFGRRSCNLDQVHGWDIKPVRFQFSTSNGQQATSKSYLKEFGTIGRWFGYHVGDFEVENHYIPMKIKFCMAQIDCTHTKGGICFDSVIVCLSEFAQEFKNA